MKLITCQHCYAAVSSRANGCIVCGAPLHLEVKAAPTATDDQPAAKRRKMTPSRWALALAGLAACALLALALSSFGHEAGDALRHLLH